MPVLAPRTDQERIKALEHAFDALHFAAETIKDVVDQKEASAFVGVVAELESVIKMWREEIEGGIVDGT